MEIKATLQKPYTDEQRLDFIVEQNHNNGYEIQESQNALEAWGLTDEEKAQQEKEKRIAAIKLELNEKDAKAVRSIRAKLAGVSTPQDDAFLVQNEQEAEALRQELKDLGGLK